MSDASLNELADAAGIEPRYWDIQGRLHERSPATARHLLAGLGIPANTETDIATSLTRLAEEPWRKALPPVIVATEGREIDVPFRLPASAANRSLRWSIEFEGGGSLIGECRLDTVPTEAMYDISGSTVALRRLKLPPQSAGYHRFHLEAVREASAGLIVAPARCYLPWQDAAERSWGIAVQLYALTSRDNCGIGDFSDLGNIVEWSAARTIDAVGLNPLHALFLDSPQDASPYPNWRKRLDRSLEELQADPTIRQAAAAIILERRRGSGA